MCHEETMHAHSNSSEDKLILLTVNHHTKHKIKKLIMSNTASKLNFNHLSYTQTTIISKKQMLHNHTDKAETIG